MKKKQNNWPRCSQCGAPATRTIEQEWLEYRLNKKGEPEGEGEFVDACGDVDYLCDNC